MIEISLNFKKSNKIAFLNFLSFKSKSKSFLFLYFIFSIFIFDISKAETNNLANSKNNQIEIEYLESRNELENYIIDSGDVLSIDFQFKMFNGDYRVNEEGELLLPEIDETYVRGLTTGELRKLLNKKYTEFLVEPDINVRIAIFKNIRVLARGELRNPGFIKFPAYKANSTIILDKKNSPNSDPLVGLNNEQLEIGQNLKLNNQSSGNLIVKRLNENISTISDVIREAGGITSATDLSKIEIIRDVPIGKGGGKKRAFINLNSYLNEADPTNDIRIFDGDSLFFPKLIKANPNQIAKSVLLGISPQFISVNLYGRVENTGLIKLPLEATLSDAIDITGPIKPLSGKVVLIRYGKDGKVIKKNISYSANAKRGSKRNPYLEEDDLISIKDNFLGKSTGVIKEVTAPFVGIYSTKILIDSFRD